MSILINSNTIENGGADGLNLQANHPSASASYASSGGVIITLPVAKYTLTSIKFYLRKATSPTGNAIGRIYAATGTVGTDAVPTGSVLASTNTLDVSTLTTSFASYELTFTSPYEATPNTAYCFVLENPASGVDVSNFPIMSGAFPRIKTNENTCAYYNGAWVAHTDREITYYLYGTGGGNLDLTSKSW